MRGAPQVGFSATIRKIRARTSLLTRLRPPTCLALETHFQYKRNPARCQLTTVLAGCGKSRVECRIRLVRRMFSQSEDHESYRYYPCAYADRPHDQIADHSSSERNRRIVKIVQRGDGICNGPNVPRQCRNCREYP